MSALRPDLEIIANHVPEGVRVLDIGCGEGDLMAALRDAKRIDARGVELDAAQVATAMARGLSVMQGDADTDLSDYPDAAFDYAILSQTLQTTRAPDRIVEELLRIAPKAFVSFPNFAYWRVRAGLLFGGRMPVTGALPLNWYETENIHHVTIHDFRTLIRDKGIAVEKAWYLSGNRQRSAAAANLMADQAVFLLGR
ncbi:methionine biosynthesis protein MetW [Parasphingopyxis marina]|uniref:Methionine biosynthesis protein MetW n=1 Tax=Parasphingopyxis marina TaxID=2761622 RepID=A0A842HUY8_9SPHN|nr:methionine biosynthesis protein MetW [Parasphingopyxis marina]MBC2776247.1 methionine biosynthesis protein MetW [Parasphingopyxis marina]